jgi:hypothetical protein
MCEIRNSLPYYGQNIWKKISIGFWRWWIKDKTMNNVQNCDSYSYSERWNLIGITKRRLQTKTKLNSAVWVRERTIPTERPPVVGEVSAKFADRGCHVVRVTDPYGRILDFLDRSRYLFFQAAPQLYSRGWVDPVSDPPLLRKSGSAVNRTRTSGSVVRNSDH